MTKTITVEGDIASADTATGLTTQGSVTAPSRQVPVGVTMIKKIIASIASDLAAAGSCVYFLRLGGAAVQNGEQTLMIAAEGGQAPQSGSDQAPARCQPVELDNVDIAVKAGETITIQAEMAGSDLGTARAVCTLVFA